MNKNLKPTIFFEGEYAGAEIASFKRANSIWHVKDIYRGQLIELFEILYPSLRSSDDKEKRIHSFIQEKTGNALVSSGNWVYFPWNGEFVHMVNEEDYFLLRTNRNKNLITKEEQQTLYDACIGIVGLSVGSSTTIELAYQGISNFLKLADFDDLSTTNLNRVKAKVHHIGESKIDLLSRQLYELNPYIHLELFSEGLSTTGLTHFFQDGQKPRVVFELIDDFEIKIRLRLLARSLGIPVVMVTSLGDSVLIDVERYDLDSNLPLFHGLLGDLPDQILANPSEKNQYAVKLVGLENIPKRALESVREIDRTLVGRPQLASTVALGGAIAAYCARKIILGENLPSGRRSLALDEIFDVA